MRRIYAGIDIGGTGTVIGLFDESRSLLAKTKFETLGAKRERFGQPIAFMETIASRLQTALAALHGEPAALAGAGFGLPGGVDPEDGVVYEATHLGWREVPFVPLMAERLGVPVCIDHDVRTFARGELQAGAARGARNALCLTIGTGIAAAVAVDGRLIRGGHNLAGEIGHDTVPGLALKCPCGKVGCLETIVSGPGIARLAAEAGLSGMSDAVPPTAEDVARLCAVGDERARGIYRYAAGLLADKLETAVALLDPEIIVIGGGVANAGEPLLEPIRRQLHDRFPWLRGKLSVVPAALGEDAALIGALHHVYPE